MKLTKRPVRGGGQVRSFLGVGGHPLMAVGILQKLTSGIKTDDVTDWEDGAKSGTVQVHRRGFPLKKWAPAILHPPPYIYALITHKSRWSGGSRLPLDHLFFSRQWMKVHPLFIRTSPLHIITAPNLVPYDSFFEENKCLIMEKNDWNVSRVRMVIIHQ